MTDIQLSLGAKPCTYPSCNCVGFMCARDDILTALEFACRKEWSVYLALHTYITNDNSAVRYGALTPYIASLTGWSNDRVRRYLYSAVSNGKVLSHKSYQGAMIRWWPIGLFEKLQNEKIT